ncbi:hypothetical protein [Streptomyces pratensis]|uniref:hypothetical protein n=1 Tax=Streptomyces pratensis TaxID=1169025 RepID=UPI001EE41522|nr:hypothetical protein [Streptomyces pratensis]
MHQAVLRYFAETGTAPGPEVLEPVAEQAGRTARELLAELAAEDFLTLDEAGQITRRTPSAPYRPVTAYRSMAV